MLPLHPSLDSSAKVDWAKLEFQLDEIRGEERREQREEIELTNSHSSLVPAPAQGVAIFAEGQVVDIISSQGDRADDCCSEGPKKGSGSEVDEVNLSERSRREEFKVNQLLHSSRSPFRTERDRPESICSHLDRRQTTHFPILLLLRAELTDPRRRLTQPRTEGQR